MERIAILTSTSPLRKTTTQRGVTKQRFNLEACIELAEKFDIIIIGSLAADEVFQFMEEHMPRDVGAKFHFYSRTFFHRFQGEDILHAVDDIRDPGWQQILSENGVEFEMFLRRRGVDPRTRKEKFSWEKMDQFVTDARVMLVTGGEGTIVCDKPVAAAG
jgi:hypothetical protein